MTAKAIEATIYCASVILILAHLLMFLQNPRQALLFIRPRVFRQNPM
jgi:hypothetical protein